MHQIEIIYEGKLRTRSTHLQSGDKIITDAPIDNKGKGEGFSPTDICPVFESTIFLKLDKSNVYNAEKLHKANKDRSTLHLILRKGILLSKFNQDKKIKKFDSKINFILADDKLLKELNTKTPL